MVRESILKALKDSYECVFDDIKCPTSDCYECAEKHLAEYENKIRVDELNKLFVAITKSVDELGDDATLKDVAEILKETIDYIYAEILRYER